MRSKTAAEFAKFDGHHDVAQLIEVRFGNMR
jgi:hypothetical protein